jgi:alkylhydroperoxidase family enzyme
MTEELVREISTFEDSANFSEREKLAMRFADYMALNHQAIDDAFFKELRALFNPAEILELGILTGIFIGYGRLLAILDLENPTTPEDTP